MVSDSIQHLIDLSGRTAVVTGSGRGMGVAIATRLAEAGAIVYVADIDLPSAEKVAAAIVETGQNAVAVALDVSDPDSISAVADRAVAETGRLDIWVNNAGIWPLMPMFGDFAEAWQRTMDVNLRGCFVGTREAARRMIDKSTGGVVINIASVAAGRAGQPSLAAYAASKAGVKTLTTTMAAALGRFGVRVVAVSPGVIVTDGIRASMESLDDKGGNLGDRGAELPLGRAGTPDDIGRVVLFLASDLASYITGATLDVDGGDNTGGRAAPTTSLEVLGW